MSKAWIAWAVFCIGGLMFCAFITGKVSATIECINGDLAGIESAFEQMRKR